jgi:hypothetical protein
MNNSLPRLIDGMVETLRREIIPHIEGDFARGQAFGLIYMLNSIRCRASWSNRFLGEQIRALEEATRALQALAAELPGAPLPTAHAQVDLPDAGTLEQIRDQGNASLCELIDWLSARRPSLPAAAVARADAVISAYLNRQIKWDLETAAKPMFTEISRGRED